MDESTLEHYFDIKTVQLDMVKDRGYIVPEHEKHIVDDIYNFRDYINNPENRRSSEYLSKKGIDVSKVDKEYLRKLEALDNNNKFNKDDHYPSWQIYWNKENTKILFVYYINQDKSIPVEFVRYFINFNDLIRKTLFNIEMSNILISNNELSTDSKENLKLIPKTRFFLDDELRYNPTQNVTNQQHILLSLEEVNELEKELKLDKSKFPGIKLDNPVVEYYGWELGNVIKIIRTERHVSILAKKSINYRIVIL
jgi:DNA-directed RNA polymerase subunit H (RpoH/RPB5)